MAKKENNGSKKEVPEQPDPAENTAAEEQLLDYGKLLSERIRNGEAAAGLVRTAYDSCTQAETSAQTLYDHVTAGLSKYRSLSLELMAGLHQDADSAAGLVGHMKDSLKGQLDARLKTAMESVRDLHAKAKLVEEAYCELEAALGDNCNAAQLDVLIDEIGGNCGREGEAPAADSSFESWITQVGEDTEDAVERACSLLDKGVQLAGINAMVDLSGLLAESENMAEAIRTLRANIDAKAGELNDQLSEAGDRLQEARECLSEQRAAERQANLTVQSLYQTCLYLEAPACPSGWESIRQKMNEILCKEEEPPPET